MHQIQNFLFLSFEFRMFEIASDFEFRYSDLIQFSAAVPYQMYVNLCYFHLNLCSSSSVLMNFTVPSFKRTRPPFWLRLGAAGGILRTTPRRVGSWLSKVIKYQCHYLSLCFSMIALIFFSASGSSPNASS